jgi:hypothetical protein
MNTVGLVVAKLAAIQKKLGDLLRDPRSRLFDYALISEYYTRFNRETESLRTSLPEAFGDLPQRPGPKSSGGLVKRCVNKIRRPPSRCPASLAPH